MHVKEQGEWIWKVDEFVYPSGAHCAGENHMARSTHKKERGGHA